jgi:UDP-N-acetylglucosamine--N-acetylmuramyl-(pentapeptide) pyrophosphoryl-undecaprenol N-acetylglucosamine transferase
MSATHDRKMLVAIACGGTGGHLFPGIAVGERLRAKNCCVTLLVSPKDIDQQALAFEKSFEVETLPASGLARGSEIGFARGFVRSYRLCTKLFKSSRPAAVLAMGGFTSAPPILAGRRCGAKTFLHESNTIPGRANRWLSWFVDGAFVSFPCTTSKLHCKNAVVSGTPVREQFYPRDAAVCRRIFGLEPARPVLLVMGGSQGARPINQLITAGLPALSKAFPELQYIHLAGQADFDRVNAAYAASGVSCKVLSFCERMEIAIAAATAVINRAGASSLAEIAALRVPAILVPYPAATDNHQFHNAKEFEKSGAAVLIEQNNATTQILVHRLSPLLKDNHVREKMSTALSAWHVADAVDKISATILAQVVLSEPLCGASEEPPALKRHHSAIA